jgi:hypothetical protein
LEIRQGLTFQNVTLYSKTQFVHDPAKMARINATFSKTTSSEVVKATLSDSGTVLQFLDIGINNLTNAVTRPFPATDKNHETITIGGRGYAMDILCPTVYPAADFHGHMITMVKA